MAISLYMDHHVPRAITAGLRRRGVSVLTAFEDGASQLDDATLLDRATLLERALFTRDDDLLSEAAQRQASNEHFCGVIFAHQLRVPIGICVNDLEIIAKVANPNEMENMILFLPL